MKLDYKKAGVDVEAGDALVDWLQENQRIKRPHQDRLISGIGGFAALFKGSFPEMKSPVLVSCTDGVGTKVKLAVQFDAYESVAQDLVAMCVNDLICCGAQPLFFLDYYACGQLELSKAKKFLKGVQKACQSSDCLLIGGETAEMPGVYQKSDFDCAGFAVGVVDEDKILGPQRVKKGDHVIGVSSSGFHSNGYSLLRQVFAKDLQDWSDYLLTPTHLYVSLVKKLNQWKGVRAYAHITGGGMDNLLRVLPEHSRLVLKKWIFPEPFIEVKKRTQMSWSQMLSTLNCGMGLAIVVSPTESAQIIPVIEAEGYQAHLLSTVESGNAEQPSLWEIEKKDWVEN